MKDYTDHNIEDHPCIASILARFQASQKTNHTEFEDMEKNINTCTKAIKSFDVRVDKLTTRMEKVEVKKK